MVIVHVHVHVKPESVAAVRQASLVNARSSRQEPGVVRFDVLQDDADETRFLLVEIYQDADAAAAHKATAHYEQWRDTVADLMAEPRTSRKYVDLLPSGAP